MDRITHQPPRQQGYGSTTSLRNDSLKHTRKHERRRKESKQGTKLPAPGGPSGRAGRTVRDGCADCPAGQGGLSAMAAQTVRQGTADCPHPCRGLSGLSRGPSVKANRTSKTNPRKTDHPRRPGEPSARVLDRPLLKLGPSGNRLQQKLKATTDRRQRRARTRRTREEHARRGLSATCSRTVRALRTELKPARLRGSTSLIYHQISQTVEAVETKVWGHDMRQPRMLYPKNFTS
jgi:hypothetical protein